MTGGHDAAGGQGTEAGATLDEGKTKRIVAAEGAPGRVVLVAKDDITAGDGAKHDVMTGKAAFATATTCNVFRLLGDCGVPVAFEAQTGPVSFTAPRCAMLPYEVVVRREAHGSYLKRHPHLGKGQIFPRLLVEFFLKTKGRRWNAHELVADDPFMVRGEDGAVALFDPAKPAAGQAPFLTLSAGEVHASAGDQSRFAEMESIARRAFLVLEKAWQLEGGRLVDFKVEFGLAPDGRLLLADVIDNDSWRVLRDGAYVDKQVYRDGGALDEVRENYRRVAETTARFRLPPQQVIVWVGSEKDDTGPITRALQASEGVRLTEIVCSAHKEPVRAVTLLTRLVQEVPDSVVIAFIGRSNGAGPVLAANTTVPVITIPANAREFPDDVWSSLRMPSRVPVLTVLEPANAAQAALQMLAARNPRLYADLRAELDSRAVNVVPM